MAKIVDVYVKLSKDGAERPAKALSLRQGLYKILPTPDYKPETQKWEFPPGSVVRIEEVTKDGKQSFIARNKTK